MTATYFGEVTALDSRAVWYSDEEDEDEDVDTASGLSSKDLDAPSQTHDAIRTNLKLNFIRLQQLNVKLTNCIISQSSSPQFKNMKLTDTSHVTLLGYFDDLCRAFVIAHPATGELTLWLSFDSTNQLIRGHQVGYLAESLSDYLYDEFHLEPSSPVIVLSQQFSDSEQLEYLSNFTADLEKELPFHGKPLAPPSLIRNPLEASLFERLTLVQKPAFVVSLPNPKNFWFDKSKNWPTVADKIIEFKLTDDSLDKTLIFT